MIDINSIVSFLIDHKTLFWLIIGAFFFILWWKTRAMNKEFHEVDEKIGKSGKSVTARGDIAFNRNTKEVLEDFAQIISGTSKISEIGLFLSAITAIISIFL